MQAMQPMQYLVTVPEGLAPGQQFMATCGAQMVSVTVPPGVGAGSQLAVNVMQPVMLDPASVPVAMPAPPPAVSAAEPGLAAQSSPAQPAPVAGASGAASQAASFQQVMPEMTAAQSAEAGEATAEGENKEEPTAPAPVWDSTWQLLSSRFPRSLGFLALGFMLVLVGKTMQEANRPAESATLWEVATCCYDPIKVNSTTQCDLWTGHYEGPGMDCPVGSAKSTEQSWEITSTAGGLLVGRPYYLVLYTSEGADIVLKWSLQNARGASLVPTTRVIVSAGGKRRQLLDAQPLPAGAITRSGTTERELLKGGSGGGSSGSSSGSSGGSSGGYGGRSRGSSGGRSSWSSTSSLRSYRGTSSKTAFGSRSSGHVRQGAGMGAVSSRRRARGQDDDDDRGNSQETSAEEDLDR